MEPNNITDSGNLIKRTEITLKNEIVVTIIKYSALDERTQQVALKTIAEINKKISTDGKKNWEECGYTSQLCQRLSNCINAKNTLFIAFDKTRPIGYVAFYTKQDNIDYANKFLKNENEAYCSWTGIDEEYKGNGLAEFLKLQIFEPEHEIQIFRGHIKSTNAASLKILQKFSDKGFLTTSEQVRHQHLYSVHKK